MMTRQDLPDGWIEVEQGELAEYINGFAFKPAHWGTVGKPIIRIQNLTNPKADFNYTVLDVDDAYLVQKGDILVSWSATLDAFIWSGPDALLNQHIFKVVPSPYLDKGFIYYLLKNSIQELVKSEHLHGTTMKHINRKPFLTHKVSLPPLNEQKRIADKIEELLSDLDQGEAALQRVQKLLASYRQAVLKAAVTGELTKEWREANQQRLESGEKLLQRILKTRRAQWNGRGTYQEPQPPSIHNLPTLPELWTWTSLESLVVDGPTNGLSLKPNDSPQGVKSFKLTATTSGEFIISDETIKYLDTQLDAASKYWLKTGDLLIQRGNTIEYVGTAATFPGPDNEYVYPDLMMRIRITSIYLTRWVNYWINFRYARDYFRGKATGIAGNMPKINGETLKALPVPLPPEEEITLLVSELDRLLAIVSSVNKTVKTETNTSATLRQSILKAAFSGELVPQNPTDEPASVLLERIQGGRRSPAPSKSTGPAAAVTKPKLQPSLWEPS